MQLKSDPHIFSGMQRDISVSRHKAESLYDAKNIRFTARDGDTMLSITNERGTIHLSEFTMNGNYLGHCVIGNYIIVFTQSQEKIPGSLYTYVDRIYKIIPELPPFSTEQQFQTLYEGNLNFGSNIETLGVYENDDIQKVYWTDGVNQPRYIFTGKYPETRITSGNDTQFDFVAILDLNENITIKRLEGSGTFAPGTIQYAFSYYNKYGRQSNIFYTTLIQYISYQDRGGSPDSKIAVCFKINVDNLQVGDFDYLRVYSIHRTSLNAVPTVKRIIDIDLTTVKDASTTFTDDGQIGDITDPTELLYLGGEEIFAQTLTQKDNTLFFGNINIKREAIPEEIKTTLCSIDKNTLEPKADEQIRFTRNEFCKSYNLNKYDSSNGYYNYVNTLNWSSPGFKIREHYRIGIQFQHKTGKWSEPVFLGDYTMDGVGTDSQNNTVQIHPSFTQDGTTGNYILNEPCLRINLNLTDLMSGNNNNTYYEELLSLGYVKARPVVVFPTIEDRLVLTQGMLCPTVYSKANRTNRTPFAQSSWFLRPSIPLDKYEDSVSDPNVLSNLYNKLGNYAEFRHMHQLGSQGSFNAEIQNSEADDSKIFYVDQSIVTMHSPDIEWDDSFHAIDYSKWNLNIIGCINFTANASDIDIQTSSPAFKSAKGFNKYTANIANRSKEAGRSLLSGVFWEDTVIRAKSKDGVTEYTSLNDLVEDDDFTTGITPYTKYLVYPWQRSGSLNNDENRGDNGTRTAVLKHKKLSNLKFSDFNTYFTKNYNYAITPVQLFSSDQVSLLKTPFADDSTSLGNVTYYGNIDTLLNSDGSFYVTNSINSNVVQGLSGITLHIDFPEPFDDKDISIGEDFTGIVAGDSAVRMKYKSTKHLLFSLKANGLHNAVILPRLSNTEDCSGVKPNSQFFWLSEDDCIIAPVERDIFAIVSHNPETEPDDVITDLTNQNITMEQLEQAMLDANPSYVLLMCNNPITIPDSQDTYYQVYRVIGLDFYNNKWQLQCAKEYDSLGKYYKINNLTYEGYNNEGLIKVYTGSEPENSLRVYQDVLNEDNDGYPYLLLAELYRDDTSDLNAFNGRTDDAVKSNLWIPAGEPVRLDTAEQQVLTVEYTQGDTWYTRYDCLKTYPFTMEDENSIVEIGSFLCESRINGDGRYDRNRGQISNLMMSPINFNLLNPVYSNHDNFFNYRILPEDYYKLNSFSNQITWSKEKQMASNVDAWTNITLANTFDLDGTMGPVNALRTWNDTIYCFQDNAISVISFNPRVQIPVTDGVPIEISNSGKLEGKVYISDSIGCSNKRAIAITPSGIYFVDPNSKELYNLAGKELKCISLSHGFSNWFKNNELDKIFYDKNRNDLYILNTVDCIVYSEVLGQFTSFMDYNNVSAMFNVNDYFYAFKNSFVDMADIPHKENMFLLFNGRYNDFFGTLEDDVYTPNYKDYWIEFISNPDAASDKIFSTVDVRADFIQCEEGNEVLTDGDGSIPLALHDEFFNKIRVYNEYQDTTERDLSRSIRANKADAKKKFRVWRVNIPRDGKHKLNRIRNTWAHIKFGKTSPGDIKMVLHDLNVQYFV